MRTLAVFALTLAWTGGSILAAPTAPAIPPPTDAAIAWVSKLGGTVETSPDRPGKPVIKVDLHGTAVQDSDLEALAALPELETLDLRLTKIGDAGVAHLRTLTKLRFLNLFRTGLSDDGLVPLEGVHDLETLLIGGTRVTNSGMSRLAAFKKLKKLSVFDTQVGDAGLAPLATLPRLEVLLVGKSKVTDEGKRRIEAARPGLKFTEPIG